jgi:hypothetical protein
MFEKELTQLKLMYEQNQYQAQQTIKKMDELIAALDRLTAALKAS